MEKLFLLEFFQFHWCSLPKNISIEYIYVGNVDKPKIVLQIRYNVNYLHIWHKSNFSNAIKPCMEFFNHNTCKHRQNFVQKWQKRQILTFFPYFTHEKFTKSEKLYTILKGILKIFSMKISNKKNSL